MTASRRPGDEVGLADHGDDLGLEELGLPVGEFKLQVNRWR